MKAVVAAIALALAAPGFAAAEQSKTFGDIEIHYNAMGTENLKPEVAKNYKITRSKSRGLLTISVLKKNTMGVAQPVPAEITATAVNLNAQLSSIDMREIKEGTAIYYLGEYRVSPPDTLKFNITAKVKGAPQTYSFDFQQEFYP